MVRLWCCALLGLSVLILVADSAFAQAFFGNGCGPGGCYRPWDGYAGGYGWGSPYGVFYEPSTGYSSYYLPPIYAPAELNYGPQAMKQFLGVDRNFGLAPLLAPPQALPSAEADAASQLAAILARQRRAAEQAQGGALPVAAARVSGLEARNTALGAIRAGDARFLAQDYAGALGRYRDSVTAAPDVADGWFRYGLVFAALGQAERAAAALRRGLALDPDWPASRFSLRDFYAGKATARAAHLETLAQVAIAQPEQPDAYFVLGVLLHFLGEPERARKFFTEAERLGDEAGAGTFLGKRT